MKKLLLILCLGCMANLSNAQDQSNQQSVQDSHHKVLGYIKGGIITDANNNFLGDFKPGNGGLVISDKNHKVIGYFIQNKVVQDANHKTLGYVNMERGSMISTIINAESKPLGYINIENGAVQDNNHSVIGYEINTEVMWAAPYFFFFKF